MSKWEMVKLGDIYEITSSKRVFQSDWTDKGIPFYRAREISKLSVDGFVKNELFISDHMYEEYSIQYGKPNAGDIMVTGVGTLGVCYVVKNTDKFYFKDGNIIWLKQKLSIVSDYVKWAFKSNPVKEQITRNSSGTTVGTYTITNAKSTIIPLPPLETQKQIAKTLDTAAELLALHKQQLAELDNLIKSTFYDMFGDPIINQKGWEVVSYSSMITEKPKNGFFAKNDVYCEDGNSEVIWISDFIDKMYCDLSNLKKVTATEKDIKNYAVSYGDMLFCRSSLTKAGIGKCSYVPQEVRNNTLFECHIIKTNVDLNKINPIFLQVQSTTGYFRNQIISNSKTSTMTTIGQEGIVNNLIILPPLSHQTQFANIIIEIEEQKTLVKKAIDETQYLLDSLISEYFE